MTTTCSHCRSDLAGVPELIFQGRSFCYRCAKKEDERLWQETVREDALYYARRKQKYEAERAQFAPIEAAFNAKRAEQDRITQPLREAVSNQKKATDDAFMWAIFTVGLVFPFPFLIFRALIKRQRLRELESALKELTEKHDPGPYPSGPSFSSGSGIPTRVPVVLGRWCNYAAHVPKEYDRRPILERDGYTCQCCGKRGNPSELEVHHVRPRAVGGTNSPRNLITLCIPCHMKEWWFGHVHVKTYRS